jgi:hypothetical protein
VKEVGVYNVGIGQVFGKVGYRLRIEFNTLETHKFIMQQMTGQHSHSRSNFKDIHGGAKGQTFSDTGCCFLAAEKMLTQRFLWGYISHYAQEVGRP